MVHVLKCHFPMKSWIRWMFCAIRCALCNIFFHLFWNDKKQRHNDNNKRNKYIITNNCDNNDISYPKEAGEWENCSQRKKKTMQKSHTILWRVVLFVCACFCFFFYAHPSFDFFLVLFSLFIPFHSILWFVLHSIYALQHVCIVSICVRAHNETAKCSEMSIKKMK